MRNFERFIGIDWSGALASVLTKAIAVAVCGRGTGAPVLKPGPWSREAVGALLKTLAAEGVRTLIGIDANFGYAQEVGIAQFGENYDYRDLWAAVESTNTGVPNYFAGGYWPRWPEHFWWEGRQPAHITLPKRATELACGGAGYGWPESPFKLLGPKQVGKGGLAAMRLAVDLKRTCGDAVCLWPFERDIADRAALVISEIYPRQFLRRCGHGGAKIKTPEELNRALGFFGSAALRGGAFSDHEADALVAAAGLRWLCGDARAVPNAVAWPAALTDLAARREGWIFGV